jgi:hypothetical protein
VALGKRVVRKMEEEDLIDYFHDPLDDIGDEAIFFSQRYFVGNKSLIDLGISSH